MNTPCTEIAKLDVEYEESEDPTVPENTTRMNIYYRSNSYKEIRQMRAYTINMLVGNIGGFFGLLLGYAFVQLPGLLKSVISGINRCFYKSEGKIDKINGKVVHVQEISSLSNTDFQLPMYITLKN